MSVETHNHPTPDDWRAVATWLEEMGWRPTGGRGRRAYWTSPEPADETVYTRDAALKVAIALSRPEASDWTGPPAPPPLGGSYVRHAVLEAKLQAATDAASRPGLTPVCRHLRAGLSTIPPMLCGQHPATGLRCQPCLLEHVDRDHSRAMEYTCDVCGQERPRIRGIAMECSWSGILLAGPETGHKRRVSVPVVVGGFGICRACNRGSTMLVDPEPSAPILGREVGR